MLHFFKTRSTAHQKNNRVFTGSSILVFVFLIIIIILTITQFLISTQSTSSKTQQCQILSSNEHGDTQRNESRKTTFANSTLSLLTTLSSIMLAALFIYYFISNYHTIKNLIHEKTSELFLSNCNLEITLKSIRDGVIVIDLDKRIIRMNSIAEMLTGWMFQDAVNKNIGQIVTLKTANNNNFAEDLVSEIITKKTGTTGISDVILESRTNLCRHISAQGSAIIDDNDVLRGVVIVLRDISKEYLLQQDLRMQNADLVLLLNHIDLQIWYLLSPEKYGIVNQAHAQFLGKHTEELNRSFLKDIYNTNDYELLYNLNREVFQCGKTIRRSLWLTSADDSRHLLSLTLTPGKNGGNNTGFIICTAQDITEQHNLEKLLLSYEKRLSLAIEAAQDGFWDYEIAQNTCYISPRCSEMLGYPAHFIKHVDQFQSLIHPEDIERVTMTVIGHYFNTTEMIEETYRCRSQNGDWKYIFTRGKIIERDCYNKALRIVGINTDITTQKRAEQLIIDTQNRLEAIFDALQTGVVIIDAETFAIVDINPLACMLSGWEKEELTGKVSYATIYPEADNQKNTYLTYNSNNSECLLLHKSGNKIPILKTVIKTTINGTAYLIESFVDITQQKEQEKQLKELLTQTKKAESAKSLFIANMSHEMRTPLNGIIGLSDLLKDTPINEEQKMFIDTILISSEHLLRLINDILDYSKIDAGSLILEHIEFDPWSVIEESVLIVYNKAVEKKLKLFIYISPEIPHALNGDPFRFKQVLINLLSNAVKFTEKGYINCKVSIQSTLDRQIVLYTEICDTGIGIPSEKKSLLFKLFVQADDSTTRRFGGTGLGLAISKRLVELMGGAIDVRNNFKQGSIFWFTVNFQLSQRIIPVPSLKEHAIHAYILDSSDHIRDYLTALLRKFDCLVSDADTPETIQRALSDSMGEDQGKHIIFIDDSYLLLNSSSTQPLTFSALSTLTVLLSSGNNSKNFSHLVHNDQLLYKPIRYQGILNFFNEYVANVIKTTPENHSVFKKSIITNVPVPANSEIAILLVDDNEINRMVTIALLKKRNFTTDSAKNGIEALELMSKKRYDIVLMDCQMPIMDGYETSLAIRSPQSTVLNHDTIIIAMTAAAMNSDRDKCINSGMNDYMSKPVKADDFFLILEKWINSIKQNDNA